MGTSNSSPRPKIGLESIIVAILLGPAASLGVHAQYTVIDLGAGVSPTDINSNGVVVGSYTKPGETLGTAFRYSVSGGLEDVGGPTLQVSME